MKNYFKMSLLWRAWIFVVMFAPLTKLYAVADGDITGYIDVVERAAGGKLRIHGWSCMYRYQDPVWVHIYINGFNVHFGQKFSQFDQSRFAAAGLANLKREAAVGDACGTPGNSAHGFMIEVPEEKARNLAGGRPYAYGITRIYGRANNMLNQSGWRRDPFEVHGGIDGVETIVRWRQRSDQSWYPKMAVIIKGWACQVGRSGQIQVAMMARRSGTLYYVTSAQTANIGPTDLNYHCLGGNIPQHFQFELSQETAVYWQNDMLSVVGFSPTGGDDLLIWNSDSLYRFPSIPNPL